MESLEHADAIERRLMDIGRASRKAGCRKMIRHYEAIGLLLKVARTFANYRVDGANDVHLLRFIKRARILGFSIEEIKELVSLWRNKSRSSATVKKIAGAHVENLKRKIVELKGMIDTPEHLARHCHGDHRPDRPILEELART
jgi:MerR family copper efflux transcriptional regulator